MSVEKKRLLNPLQGDLGLQLALRRTGRRSPGPSSWRTAHIKRTCCCSLAAIGHTTPTVERIEEITAELAEDGEADLNNAPR